MAELNEIKSACRTTILNQKEERKERIPNKELKLIWNQKEPIFCPYQIEWVQNKEKIALVEKSRQIGFSYTMAFRAVLRAVKNERDTLVSSYNKQAVKQFIKDSGNWARLFNAVVRHITDVSVVDKNEINIFEIRFLNGRSIIGLSGNSVSLRSFSGRDIILDEFAFREEPAENYLASSIAAIIHSGSLTIGSTHCGTTNDFNILVEEIKSGKKPFKLFRKVSLKQAVSEGLYKRICVKEKEIWTPEKEKLWTEEMYKNHGIRASEELDAIPCDFNQECQLFSDFEIVSQSEYQNSYWENIEARYTDLATSESEGAFYSASIKFSYNLDTGVLLILDWYAERLNPLEGDNRIEEVAIQDGYNCIQIIEEENYSSGRKYVEIIKRRLYATGKIGAVYGYHPKISKLQRLIPVANAAQKKEVRMIEAYWNEELIKLLRKVSAKKVPLISDLGDCLSGGYDFIKNEYYLGVV